MKSHGRHGNSFAQVRAASVKHGVHPKSILRKIRFWIDYNLATTTVRARYPAHDRTVGQLMVTVHHPVTRHEILP